MGKLTLLVRNSLLALLGFVLIAGGVGSIVSEFVDNQRAVSDVANEIQDVKKGVVEDAANFKYMNYGLLALFVPLFGLLALLHSHPLLQVHEGSHSPRA